MSGVKIADHHTESERFFAPGAEERTAGAARLTGPGSSRPAASSTDAGVPPLLRGFRGDRRTSTGTRHRELARPTCGRRLSAGAGADCRGRAIASRARRRSECGHAQGRPWSGPGWSPAPCPAGPRHTPRSRGAACTGQRPGRRCPASRRRPGSSDVTGVELEAVIGIGQPPQVLAGHTARCRRRAP